MDKVCCAYDSLPEAPDGCAVHPGLISNFTLRLLRKVNFGETVPLHHTATVHTDHHIIAAPPLDAPYAVQLLPPSTSPTTTRFAPSTRRGKPATSSTSASSAPAWSVPPIRWLARCTTSRSHAATAP